MILILIIIHLLIGLYLGFVCAHSISQDELKEFSFVNSYREYYSAYILFPLLTMPFGIFGLIWVIQVYGTWDIHWNIFKWYKTKKLK